jgi:hypothetical protein
MATLDEQVKGYGSPLEGSQRHEIIQVHAESHLLQLVLGCSQHLSRDVLLLRQQPARWGEAVELPVCRVYEQHELSLVLHITPRATKQTTRPYCPGSSIQPIG